MKKKILIIYATYGSGHKAIANYIDDYFTNSGEYETMSIDILDYAHKALGKFTSDFYYFTQKHAPFMWEFVYRVTSNKAAGTVSAKLQSKVVSGKKIKGVIKDFNPDVVIATHFTGATYIAKMIRNGELDTKLISVVTDYRAHPIWIEAHKTVDALVVNSIEEKRFLVKKGINPRIIKTFGIPISSKYSIHLYDKSKLLTKFNLTPERPIILFYGGGGGGSFLSLPYLLSMIEKKVDADIFFVCGKSKELYEKASGIVERHNATNVRVLGFINNGPELMMISDFVITKPGGITVTECLCFRKPMLLIRGNGGQEKDNYKYLVKNGFAINAVNMRVFKKALFKLLTKPMFLKNMEKNLEKVEKSNALQELYDLAGVLINES